MSNGKEQLIIMQRRIEGSKSEITKKSKQHSRNGQTL
jgi:hypothetical protein